MPPDHGGMAESTETLQARLTEAREALHRLMTGAGVVAVGTASGRRVQYSETQAGELRRYIADLEAGIAAASATGTTAGARNRPILVAF